jgi:site-specific DNA-methyltransferase (adenine-specific)
MKLINEDCVSALKKMDDASIHLVVTSPPYDNLRTYDTGAGSDWNADVWHDVIREMYRVMVDGGVVVWNVKDSNANGSESGTSFRQALFAMECGFNLHDTMIWSKDTFAYPDVARYYDTFEFVFVFSKGKPRAFNPICDRKNKWAGTKVHGTSRKADGTMYEKSNNKKSDVKEFGMRFNVWDIPTEKKSGGVGHPAMMPERLAHDMIVSWSNEGDIVLDPFMGSGTTGRMCVKTKRDFVGIDISENYVELARRRIEHLTNAPTLF